MCLLFTPKPLTNGFIITTAVLPLTLGALASLFIIVTAFSLSRKTILASMLITNVLTGTQFILLNQPATTFLITVSIVYTAMLMLEKLLPFVTGKAFALTVLTVQTIGYFAVNGFTPDWSLLALAGTIVGSLAMWFHNPLHLKATMLFMGFIWLSYQIAAGAYGQLPGEFVFLAGISASLYFLLKAHRNDLPLESVEEIPIMVRRMIAERKTAASVPVMEESKDAKPVLV